MTSEKQVEGLVPVSYDEARGQWPLQQVRVSRPLCAPCMYGPSMGCGVYAFAREGRYNVLLIYSLSTRPVSIMCLS